MPPAPATATAPGPWPRVLVLATEDWFVVSHFLPLLRTLDRLGADVTVATRLRANAPAIEATGARTVSFDVDRGALRPGHDLLSLARLARLIHRERPDVVHAIALKPIVLGGLASLLAPPGGLVLHLTGVGYTGTAPAGPGARIHRAALRLIGHLMRRPGTRLFVENPEDAERLRPFRALGDGKVVLLGGAGVDPVRFAPGPAAPAETVRAGFAGRMIWSKGADLLIAAQKMLRERGVDIEVRLAGAPDADNPRAVPAQTLHAWGTLPGVRWLGHVDDIAGFWRENDIAVVPSRGGEGLPRALLEAAACARPIVVADVPGCRHFVRHEVEGLLVAPDDPSALAAALERLARDPALAARLGAAARERVLEGFTEAHVEAAIAHAYRELLPGRFA